MFTATSKEKSFFNGELKVTVEYTDGSQKWSETYNVTSEDDLNNRISNRIDVLNNLQELTTKLVLGVWSKPVKVEEPVNPIKKALNDVYEAKTNLEMKIITQAEYDAVVATYKTLVGK